jgi:hypothetical protein
MKMETIEVFLQGEGIRDIQLVRVPAHATVGNLLKEARRLGLPGEGGAGVWREDDEAELDANQILAEAGVGHRSRVHCHRCHRIEVTVNFSGDHAVHPFPPSATVGRVKRWADERFGIHGPDATEHALQLCGTSQRPEEDTHIGALVTHPVCRLCFDLVPKLRVEG